MPCHSSRLTSARAIAPDAAVFRFARARLPSRQNARLASNGGFHEHSVSVHLHHGRGGRHRPRAHSAARPRADSRPARVRAPAARVPAAAGAGARAAATSATVDERERASSAGRVEPDQRARGTAIGRFRARYDARSAWCSLGGAPRRSHRSPGRVGCARDLGEAPRIAARPQSDPGQVETAVIDAPQSIGPVRHEFVDVRSGDQMLTLDQRNAKPVD